MGETKFKILFVWTAVIIFLFGFNGPAFPATETIQSLYTKGQAAYEHGEFNQAIDFYEKVVQLEPDFAPAYNALGLAHKEINTDLNEVAWLFKTAIEIDPNFSQAYDNLGKAYYGLGQFDRAEEACLKALSLTPNLPSAQMSLGWIYLLGKSNPEQAIFYFNEFLKKNKAPYGHFGLGMAYFMNGERAMVLDEITTLRGLKQEALAMQLENMIRNKSYTQPPTQAALVTPRQHEEDDRPDSSLVKAGSDLPNEEPTDPDKSMMKVRLRGKMFGMGSPEKSASSTSVPVAPAPNPSIERIRQMRGNAIHPSNSEAINKVRALQRQQAGGGQSSSSTTVSY